MDNENFDKNECEKISLEIMATTTSSVVKLNNNCAPLGWFPWHYPEESVLQSQLIKHWNITDKEVLYYNEREKE